MTLRLLINASNLRVGGVVQVGISAIDEISRLRPEGMEISVLACEGVDRNLSQIGCDTGSSPATGCARFRVSRPSTPCWTRKSRGPMRSSPFSARSMPAAAQK